MNKAKFGKFESISGTWDDTQVSTIYINGMSVGEIEKLWTPQGPLTSYSVDCYSVEFTRGNGEHSRDFDVTDYACAREALKAAKDWVRSIVKEKS